MPVRHSPPRSLAQRIMLSFALLVTFVAGFYAFALYQSIEFTEQQLISGILRDEVARAVDTLERGETPRLPEDTRLYGAPPLEAPPPTMRGLPEGFGELSDNGDFFVYTGVWRGEPLVLTRDQLGFEDTERVFRRITLFSVLAVFFLGLLAGWILSRNIMKPVKALSDEVRKASTGRTYEPLSIELTNDEVGELARHARHRRQQPREERRRLHRKRRGHDHGNVRGLHCLRLGTGTRRRRGRPHLRARRARQCSRRRRLGRRTRPFDRLAHLPPLGLDGNGGQGP